MHAGDTEDQLGPARMLITDRDRRPLEGLTCSQTHQMTIRLLIADDHDLVREGLRYALLDTGIEIVAECDNCKAAVRLALTLELDVVLLDLKMSNDWDGMAALAEIKATKPSLPVVIYTAHDRPDFARRCIELGAHSYALKQVDIRTLLATIRAAVASTSRGGDK